jgi:hypothetical protein
MTTLAAVAPKVRDRSISSKRPAGLTFDPKDDWHEEPCRACGHPLSTIRRGSDYAVQAHVCHPTTPR